MCLHAGSHVCDFSGVLFFDCAGHDGRRGGARRPPLIAFVTVPPRQGPLWRQLRCGFRGGKNGSAQIMWARRRENIDQRREKGRGTTGNGTLASASINARPIRKCYAFGFVGLSFLCVCVCRVLDRTGGTQTWCEAGREDATPAAAMNSAAGHRPDGRRRINAYC